MPGNKISVYAMINLGLNKKVSIIMTKFLKRIFQILVAGIVILVIAILGIVNFVNPNQFKDILEKETLAKTGFILKIEGPIQWRWFPLLSLAFNDISIQNLAPFTGQLFSAKTIEAKCELLPIFLGKIALAIDVKAFNLGLFRAANGQTNFENLRQHPRKKAENPKTRIIDAEATTNNPKLGRSLPITLNSLTLEEGTITFNDRTKNSEYSLQHLHLSANHLAKTLNDHEAATPFFLNAELIANHQTLAKIFLNAEWIFQPQKEQVALQKIVLNIQHPDGTTNIITGDTDIQGFSAKPIIKAHLLANALQWGKIKIDHIKTALIAEAGILNVTPIEIKIGKSQQNASLQLDLREDLPKIYLSQKADDVEIKDLLTLLGQDNKLSGKTSFSLDLSATGTHLQAWQKSLSGKAALEINNGKFYGLDLMNLLKNTQASIRTLIDNLKQKPSIDSVSVAKSELAKWKTDLNASAFTPFDSLKASATIRNGLIENPDLAIHQAEYAIRGAGTLNLPENRIQYQTSLQLKQNPYPTNDKISAFLWQTPLDIQIKGTLDAPNIEPDLSTYPHSALAFAQKALLERALQQTIEKAVKKVTAKDALQKRLNKTLGNRLNTGNQATQN